MEVNWQKNYPCDKHNQAQIHEPIVDASIQACTHPCTRFGVLRDSEIISICGKSSETPAQDAK